VNVVDKNKNTPLHLVIKNFGGNTECIQLLIDEKADINIKNGDGEKPIEFAMVKNNFEVDNIVYTLLSTMKCDLDQAKKEILKNKSENDLYKLIQFAQDGIPPLVSATYLQDLSLINQSLFVATSILVIQKEVLQHSMFITERLFKDT